MTHSADTDLTMIGRLTRGDIATKMKAIGNMLTVRPLMKREFGLVRDATETVDRQGRVLTKVSTVNANFDSATVTPANPCIYEGIFHEKIGWKYSHIAQADFHAQPHYFMFAARTFPVLMDTAHIQLRHIERAKSVLDYGSNDFLAMIGMALILSQVAESYLESLGAARAEMVVPVENGLYLGYCELSPPESLDKFRIMQGVRPPGGRGQFFEIRPSWRPKVEIVINTYVNADDLTEDHQAIFALFESILKNEAYKEIIWAAIGNYINGKPLDFLQLTCAQQKAMPRGDFLGNNLEQSAPPIRPGAQKVTPGEYATIDAIRKAASNGHATFMDALGKVFREDRWLAYNRKKQTQLEGARLG